MKTTKYILFAATLLAFVFCSCEKPKVNITSDYRDVTIVYGLLNQDDRYQYIKIYKGYLTDENAVQWASELDNISYYNDIDVKLEEYVDEDAYKNGAIRQTFTLDTVMSIPKNEGTFANPTQVLYRVKNSLYGKGTHIFRLVITNKKTGEVIKGRATLIDDRFPFNEPLGSTGTVSTININSEDPWEVGCKDANWPKQAYAVDAYVSFRYIEKNKNTGDTVHKIVRDVRVTDGFCLGNIAKFKPASILRFLPQYISEDTSVVRYVDYYQSTGAVGAYVCIDIKLWATDYTYYTYHLMSQPSSSIVQDRVAYTNMESENNSALGFFAARIVRERHFRINNTEHNEDSLIYGRYTKNLGFRPFTELLDD